MKKILAVVLTLTMLLMCSVPAFAADDAQALPFENSAFFEDGDYTLHYRTYVPQGAPLGQIILVHGFGLSTASLEGVAGEYADYGYKVVLVDVPNFGYSSRETVETKLVDRETLIYDLMTELGGKWIVGGHSMGGGIAANIAIDHPETVTGLVLFAPQTSMQPTPVMSFMMKSSPVRVAFELLIRIGSRSKSAIKSLVAMSFSDEEYAESYDLSRIMDPLKKCGTGSGMAIMTSHTRSTDIEAFGKLTVPVVIVTASDDKVASADNLNALIGASPEKLTTYNFEKGGHMMMEYSPAQAAAVTLGTIAAASSLAA